MNWQNVDSLIGLSNRRALGVYADSAGLIFMKQDGFTLLRKNTTQPSHYYYSLYNEYWSGVQPAFYQGIAYVLTSESTIQAFPYRQPNQQPFTIRLADFNLPQTPTGHVAFSRRSAITINSSGQLLVELDAVTAPKYLYTLQLDGNGRPVSNPLDGKVGHPIELNNSTFAPMFWGKYAFGELLFVEAARNYVGDNSIASTLMGELQRIGPDSQLETVLPKVSVQNVFLFNNALYAVGGPLSNSFRLYRSTDRGQSWSNLYELTNSNLYGATFSTFYQIENRLVVVYVKQELQEYDVASNQVKTLRLDGIPKTRGEITGLAHYGDKIYLTTMNGGIYVKPLKDFWQY
ncbi:hypothetical protein GCM10027341_44920 [Spirosoma knui]